MHSPDHSTKGTPSPVGGLRRARRARASTAGRCRGSGSLSFPSRGAFHLSLTVLVHYRWPGVFSLGGWSPPLPTGCLVSRGTQEQPPAPPHPLAPRTGLSPAPVPLPSGFRCQLVRPCLYNGTSCDAPLRLPYNPGRRQVSPSSPGLGSSRFARHYYGNLVLISLPRGTEMFQFPRCPWSCLCIQHAMRPLARSRVAPFGFAWLIARLQLPRHVSPLSAPFFGTWPHRHPPYTLLRLAILVRSVFLCSSPAQQPSIRAYPQRENSLRFGKIEVNLDIRL
jgi:hypothetical protein